MLNGFLQSQSIDSNSGLLTGVDRVIATVPHRSPAGNLAPCAVGAEKKTERLNRHFLRFKVVSNKENLHLK